MCSEYLDRSCVCPSDIEFDEQMRALARDAMRLHNQESGMGTQFGLELYVSAVAGVAYSDLKNSELQDR